VELRGGIFLAHSVKHSSPLMFSVLFVILAEIDDA